MSGDVLEIDVSDVVGKIGAALVDDHFGTVAVYPVPANPRATVILVNGLGTKNDIVGKFLVPAMEEQHLAVEVRTFSFNTAGRTDWCPQDTVSWASFASLLQHFDAFVRQSSGRLFLVGHSLGGLIVASWLHALADGMAVDGACAIAAPWYLPNTRLGGCEGGGLAESERRIEALMTELRTVMPEPPVDWAPPTLVALCRGELDDLLDQSAFTGRWSASNVDLRTFVPPTPRGSAGRSMPGYRHTLVIQSAAPTIAEWIAERL